jgi:hypothetical protein
VVWCGCGWRSQLPTTRLYGLGRLSHPARILLLLQVTLERPSIVNRNAASPCPILQTHAKGGGLSHLLQIISHVERTPACREPLSSKAELRSHSLEVLYSQALRCLSQTVLLTVRDRGILSGAPARQDGAALVGRGKKSAQGRKHNTQAHKRLSTHKENAPADYDGTRRSPP